MNERRNRRRDDTEEQEDETVLRMQGISYKPPNDVRVYLAKFMVDLRRSGYFSDVTLTEQSMDDETNTFNFTINGIIAKGGIGG